MKTFTLRLTDEEAKAVEIMAAVSRLSKNSAIRGCIHNAAHWMNEFQDNYRQKAQDLIRENAQLFADLEYDSIDVLGEHFDDIK